MDANRHFVNQNITINNSDILINDALIYRNLEEKLCLQLDIVDFTDANNLFALIGEKVEITMNNFYINGKIEQIIYSRNNIYIIIFEIGGNYSYGTVHAN